jgi:hypothetical protein
VVWHGVAIQNFVKRHTVSRHLSYCSGEAPRLQEEKVLCDVLERLFCQKAMGNPAWLDHCASRAAA